ncbi:MAG: DegT/DnrJ/EryC1/StrS family aminotransferase [Candidatus Bathyarchaeota archaeon]|nr:DegT/DnrJ/EryC1/StrS family aminotransferase [Candidatus Bathyarchaeota archaeon]
MSKPLIRSSKPCFPPEDIAPILADFKEVLEEGQFRNGKNVAIFENMAAQYLGVGSAIAFDSDSSAYETALRYFGVGTGDVVVCTNSFISVPNSVVAVGAKPVFADIRAETLSMNPSSLKENLTCKTRGVILTHIAGFPNPDLNKIMEICREHGLFLIEDATHSLGATVNGKKVGTFGDAGVFSFTPTKVLTTGEGGMMVTNNTELGAFARQYRFYGSGSGKTNFVDVGRHMVLHELSGVLGIHQLRRLEEFIQRRNQIAQTYNKAFSKLNRVSIVKCGRGCRCSYYKYPLILGEALNKATLVRRLWEDYGIESGNIFYPPCHMQPVYQKHGAVSYGSLAAAEKTLAQTVALPMHVGLSDNQVDYVVDAVSALVVGAS